MEVLIFLFISNIFDGAATAFSYHCGFITEANPVMNWLLSKSLLAFLVFKMLVPTICLYFLRKHIHMRLVKGALILCAIGYLVVSGMHVSNFVKASEYGAIEACIERG